MTSGADLIRATWEIRHKDGSPPVRGDLRALAGRPPASAVIICHGFKGFRNWGFFPSLARAIARRGHAAISVDFSLNGLGDDGVDFSALDRFERQTHSRNVSEIVAVLDALGDRGLLPKRPRRMALVGHSRGGAEAILAADRDQRIDALVTWNAIASIENRWHLDQIEKWRRGESVNILNSRTGQEMPIGPEYWRDILRNKDSLDVLDAASRLTIPWLIVHGDADETVPVEDARSLFAASGENAELCIVENGSHTFGAKHPYDGPTPELRTASQTTLAWLDERLG